MQCKINQVRSPLLSHDSHLSSAPKSQVVRGHPVGECRPSAVDRQYLITVDVLLGSAETDQLISISRGSCGVKGRCRVCCKETWVW